MSDFHGTLLKAGMEVLDGRFRVLWPLASGGMGEVYVAEQLSLGRQVALKVLRAEIAGQAVMSERLRREAALLAQVDHPAVVRILDFGEHQGALCLVLERIEGTPLHVELKKGPLLPDRAVALLVQLLEGLAAIHERGIVHRDLTPKNVMLTQTVLGEKARLLDFGIAQLLEPREGQQGLTAAGTVIGTPEYLAPERMRSNQADARSDIYSFGVLAYEVLSGQLPFPGPDGPSFLRQHLNDTPRPLEQAAPHLVEQTRLCHWVMKCLAKTPAQRPESAKVLAERFLALPSVGEPTLFSESLSMPVMPEEEIPVPAARAPSPAPAPVEPGRITEPLALRPEASPSAAALGPTWLRQPQTSGATSIPLQSDPSLPNSLHPNRPRQEEGRGLSAHPVLRRGAALTGTLLLMGGLFFGLRLFFADSALAQAKSLVERRAYKDAIALVDLELVGSSEARRKRLEAMKAAALHGAGQHREERRLLLGLPKDAPSWREPLVLGALVEDLGRKDEPELRAFLAALPKAETQELLVQFLEEAPEPSAKHWAALRHLDREKALGPKLLVRHYLVALEAKACGVRAAAAERLGELGEPEAQEPLRRLLRTPGCGDVQAAKALKALGEKP